MKKKKFNYIDIIIVLVIIAVGILGYKYITKDGSANPVSSKIDVEFVATAIVRDETLDQLKVGDIIVSNNAFQDGQIEKVEVEDSYIIKAIDGEFRKMPSVGFKKIDVTIKGKANKYGPYVDIGSQPVKAGEGYYIKTDVFEAHGYITKVLP